MTKRATAEPRWIQDAGFIAFAAEQCAQAGIPIHPGQHPATVFLAAFRVRNPTEFFSFVQRATAAYDRASPPRSERWEKDLAPERVKKLWNELSDKSEIRQRALDPQIDAIATQAGVRGVDGHTAGQVLVAHLYAAAHSKADDAAFEELAAATGGKFGDGRTLRGIVGELASIRGQEEGAALMEAQDKLNGRKDEPPKLSPEAAKEAKETAERREKMGEDWDYMEAHKRADPTKPAEVEISDDWRGALELSWRKKSGESLEGVKPTPEFARRAAVERAGADAGTAAIAEMAADISEPVAND